MKPLNHVCPDALCARRSKGILLSFLLLATPQISPALRAGAEKTLEAKPHSWCSNALAPAKISERSLYNSDASWTTDRGVTIKLASFRGRPQIVAMFFSTCLSACPVLLNDLQRIAEKIPETVRTNVQFVLISFDSEGDTPPVLAKYRQQHALPENWSLLHGSPEDVLEIAALLGVRFRSEAQGGFAHSNMITLLNPGGEIVLQQPGLNRDPSELAGAAAKLLGR
ncbi:MAG TPA: SCO family protein [Verrucomicrobiae bacterium]|jgi:protein SCO1/2|nr:SCO family protein [Verrucomicrobiae bacterium]